MSCHHNPRKYKHYFYCTYHYDGFIIRSSSTNEPITNLPNHCLTKIHCCYDYHGMKPFPQEYYDRFSGGWKVEYFKSSIYY